MSAVAPQPPPKKQVGAGGSRNAYGNRPQAVGLLNEWRSPLKGLTPDDVIEPAIDLEKIRRRTPIGWLQSVATGAGGAGFGAIVQNGGGTGLSYGLCFVGFGVAVGLQFAVYERSKKVADVCAEFLRFIDRLEPMGGHNFETNAEYVRAVVSTENPSLRTRFQNWRNRRREKSTQSRAGT